MHAFNVAGEEEISPWDALLLAVRRRAARVRWVDSVIAEILAQHRKMCEATLADDPTADVNPEVPPAEAREWLRESRDEERLMTRASKMAVDAGVADAVVRRLELEGRLVTDALVAGLDALILTPEQRLQALTTMHRALAAGTDSEVPASMPRLTDVQDAETVEDDDDGFHEGS